LARSQATRLATSSLVRESAKEGIFLPPLRIWLVMAGAFMILRRLRRLGPFLVPSVEGPWQYGQPLSRKRFAPVCSACFLERASEGVAEVARIAAKRIV